MRWGERATVLTSSLEGLGARGAAVAVGEGGGCWARTPGTAPGADSSSEVVPVPTSPPPAPPAPAHLPGALALLGSSVRKALVWPRWVHCPHPWSPESLLPQLAAEVALISGTHQPPAEQAATARAAWWTLGAAWWGVQTRVLGSVWPGWQLLITRTRPPPLSGPNRGGSDVTASPSLPEAGQQLWGGERPVCLRPSIIHGGALPCTLLSSFRPLNAYLEGGGFSSHINRV